MTREQFDILVREVEERFKARTPALRQWTAFWAFVGYAGFVCWLLAVVLFAALFLVPAVKMPFSDSFLLFIIGGAILGVGGVAVLRVLWIRMNPPQGRVVTRAEVPVLFATLDELRRSLNCVPFHQVLIVPECNAAVSQRPRLGVFGWHRNYLLLGLPLMESMTPEEFRAVLAHEFAHLSRDHGRFGNWIYRLRYSWAVVFEGMNRPRPEGEASLRPLINKYVDWFWPRFNAHAFVLSRSNEYEADRVAANLTSPKATASALSRVAMAIRFYEEKFVPDIWLRANEEAAPPADIFKLYLPALQTTACGEQVQQWRQQALRAMTTNADTHPCLSDRLRALESLPDGRDLRGLELALTGPSAAGAFLTQALDRIRMDVGQNWVKEAAPVWKDRHGRATALNQRLSSLAAAVPVPEADVDSLWDKARVILDLQGDEAAEPLLRKLLLLRPDHAAANFHLGRLLLERDDATGEGHVERAVAEEEDLFPQGCNLLHAYFRRSGQSDKLRALVARVDAYEKTVAESYRERSSISSSDTVLPHGLDPLQLAQLRELLARDNRVLNAHLAQKELRHFPKQRLFLLCIEVRPKFFCLPDADAETAVINQLIVELRLPGRFFAFGASGSFKGVGRKIRRLANTEVYRRL